MYPEKGYATTYVLISISILSLIAAVSVGPEIQASRRIKHLEEQQKIKAQLEDGIAEVIEKLISDPTPESDSFYDPVWTLVEEGAHNGVELSLQDISSGINLNAFNIEKLDDVELAGSLGGITTIELVQEARKNKFIRTDQAALEIIQEDTLGRIFSYYGYFNPNTTDEDTLRIVLSERIERSEDIEHVLSSLRTAEIKGPLVQKDISLILGVYAETVDPVLSAVPMININTADRSLIEAVFAFDEWGEALEDPSLAVGSLWMDRLAGEILPADLEYRLQNEDDIDWLFELVGTNTWFWRISAIHESGQYENVVVARLPEIDGTRHFQVVERHWGFQ